VRTALAVAVLFVLAAPARALEIGVWPLFRYESDASTGRLHWSVLGPLIEYDASRDGRDLRIRPLLWLRQRNGGRDEDADFVYPLASTRWHVDDWSSRFLLFSSHHAAAPDTEGVRDRFSIFPFVFYRDRGDEPADVGVLPFYLDLHGVFGYARVRAIAFPLYLRLDEPRVSRTFAPFPLVSVVGGEDGGGVHVFPVAGATRIAGRERSGYLVWPFLVGSDRFDPRYGWERRRLFFPFLAYLEGEQRESRAYGLTGYTHTIDRLAGREAEGMPWPLVVRERPLGEESYDVWRVAPFYGRSERDGIERRFYLWPLYRTLVQDDGDFHFRRRDAMLLAWRSEWDWNDATGDTHALTTLVGVLRAERAGARASGQAPAFFDALLPANAGIRALWAPLTAVVTWESGPEGLDWELLYGLASRRNGVLHGPWYVHDDER
jgi:hypothetical protein